MKTIKITAAFALLLETSTWVIINEDFAVGTYKSRTSAREAKASGLAGKVLNKSEVEFEIVGQEVAAKPTALDLLAALEKQEAAKEEEICHPYGFKTHGFDNCPHCNIHLENGLLQAGEEMGDGKPLIPEKFEFFCMACGSEFGPEITAKKTRAPITHTSTIENPCKTVWGIAIDMKAANPLVKRGAVLAECVRQGIAYYTARTQYQAWLTVCKEEETTRLANEAKSK